MRQNALFIPLLLLAFTACGEVAEDQAPAAADTAPPEAPAVEIPTVRADITLGSFGSDVTDLTAAEARPFGFRGLILAANGAEGIASVTADGAEASIIEADPPAVYLATAVGQSGTNELLMADAAGTIRALPLDRADAEARIIANTAPPRDLCSTGETALVVTAEGAAAVLGAIDGLAAVPAGTLGCAAVGDAYYFRAAEGWDRLTPEGLEPTPLPVEATVLIAAGEEVFALTPFGETAGLGVNEALVYLETPGEEPLRPLMVAPAYGNFGGILRDGALIVLDEQRSLYLIAWSEVANALGLPANLASLLPEPEPSETPIAIEDDSLDLKFRQPEFEDADAAPPPTGNR